MITKKQAQKIIYQKINEKDLSWPDRPEMVILEEETIEKEYGWIFFYQSKKFMESGNISDALAGNAPYIFNKHSGEIIVTGTAYPIDYYITEYERRINV